jgi:NADH-quinone oxidoreductase subunit L
MTFHGEPRWDANAAHADHGHDDHAKHEAHATHDHSHDDHSHDDHAHGHHGGPPQKELRTMTWPLIALAMPSVLIGVITFKWLLFGGGFGESIFYRPENAEVLREIGASVGDWLHFALHAVVNPVFYLMLAGVLSAWALYIKWPHLPGVIDSKFKPLRVVLENKYYFDWFNENVLAAGSRLLGKVFWKVGDQAIIDTVAVNGSANSIGFIAGIVRRVQSGYLYSYAFWMVIGLAVMLGWFLNRSTP